MARKTGSKASAKKQRTGANFREIQSPKKRALLNAYTACGQLLRACYAAHVNNASHYH